MSSLSTFLSTAALSLIVYYLTSWTYRLFLNPLSKVPGPKLAAWTGWYEFYWDCIKPSLFKFHVEELHKKYGPVVRIRPNEVHIDDPAYFNVLYGSTRLEKDETYYRMFGYTDAAITTQSSELHRARRNVVAKYFSAANVARLDDRIQSHVETLCQRIEEYSGTGKPLSVTDAVYCLGLDLVSYFLFPKSLDVLKSKDFPMTIFEMNKTFAVLIHWIKHFPIIIRVLYAIPMPKSVSEKIVSPGEYRSVLHAVYALRKECNKIAEAPSSSTPAEISQNLLHGIKSSPNLPDSDKSAIRLFNETQSFIGAGSETISSTVSHAVYYILTSPTALHALKSELQNAGESANLDPHSDILPADALRGLPYLQALIKETHRLACVVSARLPRFNKTSPMSYTSPSGETYTFPPGTVLSMCISDVHLNSSIFPDPHTFSPERWLDTPADKRHEMEHYLIPFSRGHRNCVGMELARQELLLVLGNLFWKFDLQLHETTVRDVRCAHDYFTSYPERESKGVRVLVK